MKRETVFSECRKYRYTLWREWDIDLLSGSADDLRHGEKFVMFIGLNPSTANETEDDPTIRRCVSFSKRWGYGAFCMTNLFAFRATDPKEMKKHPTPEGSMDAFYLSWIAQHAGLIVAAWGKHGAHLNQDKITLDFVSKLGNVYHLGLNKDGTPKHPLYLKSDSRPFILKPLTQ